MGMGEMKVRRKVLSLFYFWKKEKIFQGKPNKEGNKKQIRKGRGEFSRKTKL